MTEAVGQFFSSITHNDYLTLFIVSMIPLVELRGGLILAAGMNVNRAAAMFTCVAGSSAVIIPIILLIKPLIRKLKSTKLFHKLGLLAEDILTEKAEKVKQSAQKGVVKKASTETKKFLGLMIFVGVPLPMTGAWTGSCVSAVLEMKLWKGTLAIVLGNIIAAGILTVLMMFVPNHLIDVILYAFLAIVIFGLLLTVVVAVLKHKNKDDKNDSKTNCDTLQNGLDIENSNNSSGNDYKAESAVNSTENEDIDNDDLVDTDSDMNEFAEEIVKI